MAVTRAEKEAEFQQLEAAFKGSESAILVDFKGLNVPQVTELRRQLRSAKASYKVVKNTIAKRAVKGTSFQALEKYFEGTTGVAYTATDPVALAKTLTTFVKTAPTLTIKAAVVQGRTIKPAEVTELASMPGRPELLAKLLQEKEVVDRATLDTLLSPAAPDEAPLRKVAFVATFLDAGSGPLQSTPS